MIRKIPHTVAVLAAASALCLGAPAVADEDDTMMQQGRSGMMMGGGGMGMMGQGRGMGGGQMMGPGMMMGSGMMGSGMMGGGMGMGMATMHALDLDRDQVRKMTQIHKELAQMQAGTRAEVQELRWEMAQEMAKERPTPSEVGKLYEQMAAKHRAMIEERIRARNRMQEALTKEQRERFRQMMQNMRQMRMQQGYGPMELEED